MTDQPPATGNSSSRNERPMGPFISGTGHLCFKDAKGITVCECIKGEFAQRIVDLFRNREGWIPGDEKALEAYVALQLAARSEKTRKFEEKPIAWLIERPKGTGKQQTVEHELVLSPLTDDTFLDEGDSAYPLFREVYTQEQIDAAEAEAARIHAGLRIE